MPNEKPNDKSISFWVNEDELAILDKACELEDRKRANYIKRVILRDAAEIIGNEPPEVS